jgi:6-phosphofructokinase 2
MTNIATLTLNPTIDKYISLDKLQPFDKLKAKVLKKEAGGGGINVSRALLALDTISTAVYPAAIENAVFFDSLLANENIQTLTYPTNGAIRENLIVKELSSGLEYRLGFDAQAIAAPSTSSILDTIANIPQLQYLVLSGSIPKYLSVNILENIANYCFQNQIKLVIDTSQEALALALQQHTFLLKPNTDELAHILGRPAISLAELPAITAELLEKYPVQNIAISKGADGAILANKQGYWHCKPPKTKVLSTVGAGDSMLAGLLYGFIHNFPMQQILQYGVTCGTAATMNAAGELCQKPDIDHILAQF